MGINEKIRISSRWLSVWPLEGRALHSQRSRLSAQISITFNAHANLVHHAKHPKSITYTTHTKYINLPMLQNQQIHAVSSISNQC